MQGKKTPISPEEEEIIVDEYLRHNVSIRRIAATWGSSEYSIRKIMIRHNIDPKVQGEIVRRANWRQAYEEKTQA